MEKFKKYIDHGKRFLVTTHYLPDGDGLGAQMALHLYLKKMGKTSHVINASPTPPKYELVDPSGEIKVYRSGDVLPAVDYVFVVDTNDYRMLGPFEAPLRGLKAPVVFIDHHVREEPDAGRAEPASRLSPPEAPTHLIDESYSSTGELIYALLEFLGAKFDRAIATAIYVALVTDTDSFRFKRTSARSHRIAALLLEQGVEPEEVYRFIYAHDSLGKVRLLGHVLEGTETTADERVAWLTVTKKMRDHYGATVEDTESFVNQLTLMDGVDIGLLFREEDDGRVKVSLRGNGSVAVYDIAKKFGGGGHRHAAGMRVHLPLKKAIESVVSEAVAFLGGRPAKKKG